MPLTSNCCPAPSALGNIVTSTTTCPTEFGQIRKIIFWRRGNALDAVGSIAVSTVFTGYLSATDDTKMVVSPYLTCVIPPSEAREAGSGNEVPNGIPRLVGSTSPKAEGMIWQTGQDVIALMRDLECEYLDVMFVNESNQLVYNLNGTAIEGFPIHSLFIADPAVGSFDEGTRNPYSFYLEPNWSEGLRVSAATTFLLDAVNA